MHRAPWSSQSDKCAKGRKGLCHAALRDGSQGLAVTVQWRRTNRLRHCNALRQRRGGAGMAPASAGRRWPALCRAPEACATASQPVARLKPALYQSCTGVTAVHRADPGQRWVSTQKRVRHGVRPGRRQRGWPEVPEGLAGPDGVAAGAAAGMAPDAVPEMGLGPGWLRSQPAQPSAAMIASTAARRARRLQVTGASLRRRAGKGCAGRYAWSYCSRSPAGRRAGPALGKRRNAQYDERSARRAGGRNPSAVPAPDRASTRP
ncbi:hypothetical protein CBM2588_B10253 [Cupriavidus taiwanensis]|nr:hypothetical protein CBM2588_B10253 [Cupriavidus taiwanensis]SOZ83583.1 hypothetical protein CBM2618_B10257 [Cupriavidus taiwanensis]SOZ86193.1 hypothetical protein CBM2622_B10256 [Cupriavidus taiwanensis]SPD58588.1 protein of unknown function [Cupriavidus taiwanensis]